MQKLANAAAAIGAIGVMLAAGKYLLPRLLREASEGAGGAEALLVISAAAAFGAAVLTAGLGFGSSLGAFLAGFLLSNTPFRHQLGGQLSPLRDLFMAVFFTSVGVAINLGAVAEMWLPIAIGVVVVLVFKVVTVGGSVWAGGATAATAAAVGFALCQAGAAVRQFLGCVNQCFKGLVHQVSLFRVGVSRRGPRRSRPPSS